MIGGAVMPLTEIGRVVARDKSGVLFRESVMYDVSVRYSGGCLQFYKNINKSRFHKMFFKAKQERGRIFLQ